MVPNSNHSIVREESAACRLLAECPPNYETTTFSRISNLKRRFQISHGTVYNRIADNQLVPGIRSGSNMRVWPDSELNLYSLAYVQGFSCDSLRELTRLLMLARRKAGLRADHVVTDQQSRLSVLQTAKTPEESPGGPP